jgi:methylated-DNA-[protein]-cysteine S-methyltransferase
MARTPPSPLFTTRLDSPLGPIVLAATERALCGLWFEGQQHGPAADTVARWTPAPTHTVLQQASEQVLAYLQGQRQRFELPLDLGGGTDFQQSVWQALLGIGWGQTSSYGALAQQIGRERAVRAVGAAIGRNPLSLVVPCHRVVGAQGQLTGYAGGLHRKQALLQLENRHAH